MPRDYTHKYRRKNTPSGPRAFVELDGKRVYLGEYGSQESRAEYRRVLAEWHSTNQTPTVEPARIRIVELIARYWAYVEDYYRKDGTPTQEQNNIKDALRPLREVYGQTFADAFGPLALKTVRQAMMDKGWCRGTINKATGRIKRLFRWATENQLIPPSVWHGLTAVAGLKAGRTAARESEPVKPVHQSMIDAALANTTPTIQAMIRVQLLTGCRPAELCNMRTGDLDMGGKVWTYRPARYKTQHYGHKRQILIGPEAQKYMAPYLQPDLQAHIFSPARSEQERRDAMHARRKTPMNQGNKPGSNRQRRPGRRPGSYYTVNEYGHAIDRAMDKAFPPPPHLARKPGECDAQWRGRLKQAGLYEELRAWRREHRWNPNQLRHSRATELRKTYGIDKAQTILGHRLGSQITEVYGEAAIADAVDIMAKIG